MNAPQLVVGPSNLFGELYRKARTGDEIIVYRGDFGYLSVSTAYQPGTAGGVFIREDDTFSVIADDGQAHTVFEDRDEQFSLFFPGMMPPAGVIIEDVPHDIPEWIAGPFGPYILDQDGRNLFRIVGHQAKLVYQSEDPFDYRVDSFGRIYIRRKNNFFRINNDGSEAKLFTGSCKNWGIGPADMLVMRRNDDLFFVYHDGSEQKFFSGESSFECRITPVGIHIRRANTFFRISLRGHLDEIYSRPENEDFCSDWDVGPAGIFFRFYDDTLRLVVVK